MASLTSLPTEILQQIATHLPSITDLLHLSLTSHNLHTAITSTQAVFRTLFLQTYDAPPQSQCHTYAYRRSYHLRQYLQHTLSIPAPPPGTGSPLTPQLLQCVKDLILEAHTKNLPYLTSFAQGSLNHLPAFRDLSSPLPRLLMALQLLLSNLSATSCSVWADSPLERVNTQRWAYSSQPLFPPGQKGVPEESLVRLWRIVNVFLLHFRGMMEEGEGLLKLSGLKMDFKEIVGEERGAPGWGIIGGEEEGEKEVPRYWFGCYVHMEPQNLRHLRTCPPSTLLPSHYDGRLSILTLTPSFSSSSSSCSTFTGHGSDIEDFTLSGNLSSPNTLHGIPGWRRIGFTFKYPHDTWLYEGCLLPGARTIVGSWRDELEMNVEGPFMMWAVGEEEWAYERALREGPKWEDDFLNH